MGKAFVAKLAKEGARDPEALAAWIGRKKHGRAAFAKLSAKGRKKRAETSEKPAEAPEVRTARARVAAAEKSATEARQQADRANESASAAYGRFAGGQKILTGHYTERSALRDRARADSRTRRAIAATEAAERAESRARTAQAEAEGAEMRAARSRPWARGDFQAGDTVTMDRAGRPGESYRVVRANAKSVTVSRGQAGMDNKTIPYDKILSRSRDGETTSDPGMSPPAAERPALPTPAEQRAAAMARLNEASARRAEEARQEAAERHQRTMETLARINAGATGRSLRRKTMTKDERTLVNNAVTRLLTDNAALQQARAYEDESAQTNRVDVLRSRAFNKAREQRLKNGWAVPGEDNPTPSAPTMSRRRNPAAEARERTAEQQRETAARARLAEAAAARASVRDNRPADVDASLERVDALLTRYRSGLSSGSITRTSDQRLTGFADLLRKLQQRDPAEFNRAEARAIVDFGRLVRSEAARRGLPI